MKNKLYKAPAVSIHQLGAKRVFCLSKYGEIGYAGAVYDAESGDIKDYTEDF